MNKAIVFISSNREPDNIIKLCSENLKKIGLPIISVTQKPMDLGKNICVGDQGQSEVNIFWQIGLGCLEAKEADCIFWCESDTLYPPEHFLFTPTDDTIWFNANIWRWHKGYYIKKKRPSVCSLVSEKLRLINMIDYYLKNHPKIRDWKKRFGERHFFTHQPIVNIFHQNGLHKKLSAVEGKYTRRLPYWPRSKSLLGE